MIIIPMNGHTPQISPSAFIAPTAVLIGNVVIGEGSSIFYGAVLRGDQGRIVIGSGTNVQDNVTIHIPEDGTTVVGDNVTIGHGAVLEGCTVEAGSLIGMNAVIMQDAVVGEGAFVAAGSIVTENMKIPPRVLVAGVPAKVKKELEGNAANWVRIAAPRYRELSSMHRHAVNAL
jgi:carbonic anhydrase/acetyltransferase-like protein (isoleucine patch superfamily)